MDARTKEKIFFQIYKGIKTPGTDLDLEIAFSDCEGNIYSKDPLLVVTGTRGTWTFTVRACERDYEEGTVFVVTGTNYHFAHKPQKERPKGRDYLTIRSETKADLSVDAGTRYGFTSPFCVKVERGIFKKGEHFTVTLGDRTHGGPGSETYWTVTSGKMIVAALQNELILSLSKKSVGIEGRPHPDVCAVRLLVPTVADVNEAFSLHVSLYDRNSNIIEDADHKVWVEPIDGLLQDKITIDFSKNGAKGVGCIQGLKARKEGVYRFKARLSDDSRTFLSNPIKIVKEPTHRVYWGDLHAHGWGDRSMYIMSDRTDKMDPFGRHFQARWIGMLDFCAIGPMSMPLLNADEIWQAWKDACCAFDTKNEYVPFLSYESHPAKREGDRTIIFKGLDEPCPPAYETPLSKLESSYGQRDDVLFEAHIGGQTPKWDTYDSKTDRLIEVISAFGNAEWLMQKALAAGRRFAVCGCTDLHAGLQGGLRAVETGRGRNAKLLNQRDSAYGTGPLTACVAPELTRDHLWQSLTQGSTYAVSGARIYLEVTLNGAVPGQTVPVKEKNTLSVVCHAVDLIDRIDMIVGQHIIKTARPNSMDCTFLENISQADIVGDWLYIRVRQKDEHFAISTPHFLSHGLPKWNHSRIDIDHDTVDEAGSHQEALETYLQDNEQAERFTDIRPMGIVHQENATCALFSAMFDHTEIMIRWYYMFEMPKIRIDQAWFDSGVMDDEADRRYDLS